MRHGPPDVDFQLVAEESGVYLCYAEDKAFESCEGTRITAYLNRKKLQGLYDIPPLLKELANGKKKVLVAPSQRLIQLDEDFDTQISESKMIASILVLIGDAEGRRLTVEFVVDRLRARDRVTEGVDPEKIAEAIAARDYTHYVPVAFGREPVQGVNGSVRYFFNTEHDLSPKELEGGRVDYRELNLFETCAPGQLLADITLPTNGVEGATVQGKYLRAVNGKKAKVSIGKGVRLSEDGLGIYATVGGRVDFISGKVSVAENFEVPQDMDMTVGNIAFAGDVTVRGAVISGMTIKSGGNIEIYGAVEAAYLNADSDVVLHHGMQGMNKGSIWAGGSLVAQFIERTKVICEGEVIADALVHCEVACLGEIIAAGKRGVIFGGEIFAPQGLRAKVLGSAFDAKTVVTLGLSPAHMAEWADLATQRDTIDEHIAKEDALFDQVQKSADMSLSQRSEILARVAESKVEHKRQLGHVEARMNMYDALMQKAQASKIHIHDKVYPGTRIVIGEYHRIVRELQQFVTFKLRDGEVVITPYEYIDVS